MALNRPYTAADYVNMAFLMPEKFSQLYREIPIEMWNEIIDTPYGNRYILDLFEKYRAYNDVFNYILSTISITKFNAVNSCRNSNRQILLQTVASLGHNPEAIQIIVKRLTPHIAFNYFGVSDNRGMTLAHILMSKHFPNNAKLLELIFSKTSTENLSNLLSHVDSSGKTPFHYQSTLPELNFFKKLLQDKAFVEGMSEICQIQDNEKKTILQILASDEDYNGYTTALLDAIEPDTHDKIISLINTENENLILTTAMYNDASVLKSVVSRVNVGSPGYQKAINQMDLNSRTPFSVILVKINNIISNDADRDLPQSGMRSIIAEINQYFEVFETMLSTSKGLTCFNENPQSIFTYFYYLAQICLFIDINERVFPELTGLKNTLKKATMLFADKIGARNFFKGMEQFRGNSSFYFSRPSIDEITSFHYLLLSLDYVPYVHADPLKVLDFLDYNYIETDFPPNASRYRINELKNNKRNNNLIVTKRLLDFPMMVTEKPEKYLNFFTKIVSYQMTPGVTLNKKYIELLDKAQRYLINTLSQTSRMNLFSRLCTLHKNSLKQVRTLLTHLNHLAKPIHPKEMLAMSITPDMTLAQYEHSASLCKLASLQCKDDVITDLKLQLNELHFLQEGARKYIHSFREDEKKNDDLSLDSDDAVASIENDTQNLVLLLNSQVIDRLDDPALNQHASHTEIDEANCEILHTQLYASLENLVRMDWQKHMIEFGNYILRRSRMKPFLNFNSQEDFCLRKAYFDHVKFQDMTDASLLDRIQSVDDAINDPKLTKGYSKTCLKFLKLLKEDLLNFQYLDESKHVLMKQMMRNGLRN
jgi:hypothetical protein